MSRFNRPACRRLLARDIESVHASVDLYRETAVVYLEPFDGFLGNEPLAYHMPGNNGIVVRNALWGEVVSQVAQFNRANNIGGGMTYSCVIVPQPGNQLRADRLFREANPDHHRDELPGGTLGRGGSLAARSRGGRGGHEPLDAEAEMEPIPAWLGAREPLNVEVEMEDVLPPC